MKYSAQAVANTLLDLAEKAGKPLNPMQIQKLVYFSHGWHLAITGRPLLNERIEAWTYGPVVPSLYHDFKEYGSGAIKDRATTMRLAISPKTGRRTVIQIVAPTIEDEGGSEEERAIARGVINKVWQVYGRFSAVQLSQMTHERSGPWDTTRRANPGVRGVDIPDELIKADFVKKAETNERARGQSAS